MIHVFRWDPQAMAVPPYPRPAGHKLKRGTWVCVMCHALIEFVVWYDQDHSGDCPGWIPPATGELPGSQ